MLNPHVQQAWREKVTLCFIIMLLCVFLAFLTFGFNKTICIRDGQTTLRKDFIKGASVIDNENQHRVIINGDIYDIKDALANHAAKTKNARIDKLIQSITKFSDVSPSFVVPSEYCNYFDKLDALVGNCINPNITESTYCHHTLSESRRIGPAVISWQEFYETNKTWIVFKDRVIDLTRYFESKTRPFGDAFHDIISSHIRKDASKALSNSNQMFYAGQCMASLYTVGSVNMDSFGCLISDIILYLSLVIILSVVLARFALSIWFSYFISTKLGELKKKKQEAAKSADRKAPVLRQGDPTPMQVDAYRISRFGMPTPPSPPSVLPSAIESSALGSSSNQHVNPYESVYTEELYSVMLVTCYSEGQEGLKTTLDSLASTFYSDDYKLIFVVADGLITGAGNSKSTPQLILDMVTLDPGMPYPPEPVSYVAIGEGSKRHNMAQVYAAWYNYKGHSVPTIVLIKCGTPAEQAMAKPGNRGKRDSQMILMNFFRHIMLDEPLCPLDYDIFEKVRFLMGITPDVFEILLMVDADTKVAEDSLSRMVACMYRDPNIMGLCGETRIANKTESWVSRIQVFEYYLSHHLNKAFESVFGGVTCLPGCFCMYRIKAPRVDGTWVPIICNPEITDTYSQHTVDTLHKKNLFLLGEDRFLTTLMLRTFPRRKLIFVPRAFCKTTVPAQFSVLLSQRRRWINSTIHNLMELVLVRELCGTFCFSMQAIVVLELIGTCTLPAAIVFTL